MPHFGHATLADEDEDTMNDAAELGRALLAECERRLFDESRPRIEKCLEMLSDDQIWWRPNDSTVSVGNLVLHLCGNVRQWIIGGLGGAEDKRRRSSEFEERGPIPRTELLARLGSTLDEAQSVMRKLEPTALLQKRTVQGFDETDVTVLIHVVEHFSYHTGQITYAAKSLTDRDTGYYAGLNLEQTGG